MGSVAVTRRILPDLGLRRRRASLRRPTDLRPEDGLLPLGRHLRDLLHLRRPPGAASPGPQGPPNLRPWPASPPRGGRAIWSHANAHSTSPGSRYRPHSDSLVRGSIRGRSRSGLRGFGPVRSIWQASWRPGTCQRRRILVPCYAGLHLPRLPQRQGTNRGTNRGPNRETNRGISSRSAPAPAPPSRMPTGNGRAAPSNVRL